MQERIDIIVSERGSRVVKRNLESVGASAQRAQGGVQLLTRALGGLVAAAGFTRFITSSVRLLADFGQEMATVKAITGATETQFKALSAEAERLGATTRFSASQAAEGMKFLARAGFDTDQVLKSTSATLLLAQSGAIDLGRAADISSNVLTGFRLEAEEMGRVVDVMALAANSANTDIQQLGDALKFVAPVAAGLGISLETTTAAIGKLSDAGLQGTLAGTGLRRVLSELESPSEKNVKVLTALGIKTEEVKVSQVGLTAALRRLKEAGVDTGQALEFFGERGGPAFEVLSNAIPDIDKMDLALQNAGGTAAKVAAVMDDTLNGALLAVNSAYESVIIAFGNTGATDGLKSAMIALADGIRVVGANMETVVPIIQTVLQLIAVQFARVAIPAAILAVRALGAAILANPIGILATAIAVGISALISFRDTIPGVNDAIDTVSDSVNAVIDLFSGPWQAIKDAVTSIFPSLNDFSFNWQAVGDAISIAIRGIVQAVDFMRASFLAAKDTIVSAFSQLPAAFAKIGVLAVNALVSKVEQGVNATIDLLNKIPGVGIGQTSFTRLDVPNVVRPTDVGQARFDQELGSLTAQFDKTVALTQAKRELATVEREEAAASAALKAKIDEGNLARDKAITNTEALDRARAKAGATLSAAPATIDKVTNSTRKLSQANKEAKGSIEELATTAEQKGATIGQSLSGTFNAATDALANFVKTGKFDFKSLISSMIQDIGRLLQQKGGLSGLFGGSSSGGGLFGNLFGGSKGGSGGLFGGLGSLFGFANGGSFDVGGVPGRDQNVLSINNRPVAKVSRGERVAVSPQGGGGGGGPTIIMNIETPDAESFQRSQGQIQARAFAGAQRANKRNN